MDTHLVMSYKIAKTIHAERVKRSLERYRLLEARRQAKIERRFVDRPTPDMCTYSGQLVS
jgi:hypothetical protein